MGILTATVTNPTNPVLTVSWKDLYYNNEKI
jgi:hypothetical protein